MTESKNTFLSYSSPDRDFAEAAARELRAKGLDVWFDQWEIKAGDSIVHKIFSQGLHDCDCFLILLSGASVESNWVRHELDSAMIRKLEGVTRIIPLLKEKCEIPPPLRPLHWVDMSSDFDGGIDKILHAVHEVTVRPPLGETPSYITTLSDSVGELSKVASTVGMSLLNRGDEERGNETSHSGPVLNSIVPILTEQQINDAVDELEEFGLVRTIKWLGTGPFDFGEVSPTYALFLHFDKQCDYAPEADIKTVAAAVAASSQEQMNGEQLQAICQLSPLRINRAVAYLDDYDYVDVRRFLGNAPFDFGYVRSTRMTRQFVAERCA